MCAVTVPVVGFSANNSLLARAAVWLRDLTFTHVWFEYTDRDLGGRWILEASAAGMLRVPLEQVVGCWRNINRFALREGDLHIALQAGAQYCGDKYGYLHTGCQWRGWLGSRREVRSELIVAGFQVLALPGTEQWNGRPQTPDDLYLYCISRTELFTRAYL